LPEEESLNKGALLDYDSKPEFAAFVCKAAGLKLVLDESHRWEVAGHELRVELALDRRCLYVLFIREGWPTPPARKSLCLAEVYAIALTGKLRRINGPELRRFKVKALLDGGFRERPEVGLAHLPADAPEFAQRTLSAVEDVLAVRITNGESASEPFPFSAPWTATFTGTDETTLRRGKLWLEQHGVLNRAGHAPSRFPRQTQLWRARLEGAPE